MSDSWDHRIVYDPDIEQRLCSAPRCDCRPTYRVSYRYVTGRAGRVGRATRGYCPAHAAKFAARHGLAVPPATELAGAGVTPPGNP